MKTRVAVIGLGPMGERHVQSVLQSDRLQLVAVADKDPGKLRALPDKPMPGEVRGYEDYRPMIRETRPDLVIIATNGPSHEAIFHDLVQMGVRKILCEKPVATCLDGAEQMLRAAEDNGVLLVVNHARRWCEDYVRLKAKLNKGCIGAVESVYFSMGGGQLGCNGTHFVDLIHFLLDSETVSVYGALNDLGVPNPRGPQFHDPGGYLMGRLANGKRYYLEMTEDLGLPPYMVINGTYGRVIIEETRKRMVIEKRRREDWNLPVTRYGTPLSDIETIPIEHLDIVRLNRTVLEALAEGRVLADPVHAVKALEVVVSVHCFGEDRESPVHLPLRDESIRSRQFTFT